jgi:molybdate transport system substrate-binding protein
VPRYEENIVKVNFKSAAIAAVRCGFVLMLAQGLSYAQPGVQATPPKPGDVIVIMSNGLRAPMEAVRTQAEQAAGHPIAMVYGASLALKPKIEAGDKFDIAVLTPEALEDLMKQGKIVPGSRFDIARVPVAIGFRGDGAKMDISTLDSLKKALLSPNVKSIRYAGNGASLPAINKMVETLGIAAEFKAKAITQGPAVMLGPGEIEFNINLLSEILPNKNLQNLGVLPKEVNVPAVMAAGISANPVDPKAAKDLMKFFQGATIEPALSANGMMR